MLFAALAILWHNVNGVNARVHGIARRIAKKRLIKNIRLNVQRLGPSKSWNWDFVKISLMRLCDMRLSIETLSLIEVRRGSWLTMDMLKIPVRVTSTLHSLSECQ